jgi:hypothetical protein
MLELYILIILILFLLLLVSYKSTEAFSNTTPKKTDYILTSCPAGYTSFNNKDGDTICCHGQIIGGSCITEKQCALSASSSVANCVSVVLKDYEQKASEFCPSTMVNYYENQKQTLKGCTSGDLNATMDGLDKPSQPACKIYNTLDANLHALDSCSNHKEMDAFRCFGENCVKALTQTVANSPVLITVSFTDGSGIQRTGSTRASLKRFLDATKPNWKDAGMDLSKNVAVAEVLKAVYIDKTMSKDDVQN